VCAAHPLAGQRARPTKNTNAAPAPKRQLAPPFPLRLRCESDSTGIGVGDYFVVAAFGGAVIISSGSGSTFTSSPFKCLSKNRLTSPRTACPPNGPPP